MNMSKKIILVIASNGFQHKEYYDTRYVLIQEGFEVITASDGKDRAIADDGSSVAIDKTLSEIHTFLCDGMFLIGGPGAMECLNTPLMHRLLNEMYALKKPYGAICIAPRILAKADVLRDKKVTCWNQDKKAAEIFEKSESFYSPKLVVTDDCVVTASEPAASKMFARAIVALYVS